MTFLILWSKNKKKQFLRFLQIPNPVRQTLKKVFPNVYGPSLSSSTVHPHHHIFKPISNTKQSSNASQKALFVKVKKQLKSDGPSVTSDPRVSSPFNPSHTVEPPSMEKQGGETAKIPKSPPKKRRRFVARISNSDEEDTIPSGGEEWSNSKIARVYQTDCDRQEKFM